MEKKGQKKTGFWGMISEELSHSGIDLEAIGKSLESCGARVVCVPMDLKRSVTEMGETTRDQVVMVRLDEATLEKLDAWVETGAVKSRSEAAALFIREGLTVRSPELEELDEALRNVEEAKGHLREKASEIFGNKDKSNARKK